MELIYGVKDKPTKGKLVLLAFQQLLAILAGTITLPLIVGHGLSQSAALIGASIGTLVYLLITKFKSPVFLGSSFTFIGAMASAFAGAASAAIGYAGIILGALMAGLVYILLSIIVKKVGSNWIEKIMPPVIIGPVVALIGLTLAPNAINSAVRGNVFADGVSVANPYICLAIAFVTLGVTIAVSVHAKGFLKLIPFIIGIFAGYLIALVLTLIGNAKDIVALKIIDLSPFQNMTWLPDFAFLHVGQGFKELIESGNFGSYLLLIFTLYVPISFACFAEHIADHKNLSSIIESDLIEDPGLHRTLLGDGVGTMVGAIFGGTPNTTYGESISCVAFSKNASIITIITACCLGIGISFVGPLMAFFATIPACVVGGLSIALYGYIAASGLRMLRNVDMQDTKNIFVLSTILVCGIGGLTVQFKHFEFSPVACALVAGILVNLLVKTRKPKNEKIDPKESKSPGNP